VEGWQAQPDGVVAPGVANHPALAGTPEEGNHIPGLFDEVVFDQAIQEFLDKREELADYFDDALAEDIFSYVPQQKTSLVFTPKAVVRQMCDILETENPGILATQIPSQHERLHHIFTKQIYGLSPNSIMQAITLEAVSGGDPERDRIVAEMLNSPEKGGYNE
jgi:type II restriction enzyme